MNLAYIGILRNAYVTANTSRPSEIMCCPNFIHAQITARKRRAAEVLDNTKGAYKLVNTKRSPLATHVAPTNNVSSASGGTQRSNMSASNPPSNCNMESRNNLGPSLNITLRCPCSQRV